MIVIMKPPCEFYFSHGNYLDKPIRRSKVAARSYILVDRIRQVSNQLVYRGSFGNYDPKPGFSKGGCLFLRETLQLHKLPVSW